MKTAKSPSAPTRLTVLAIATALSLASCQKEDTPAPNSVPTTNNITNMTGAKTSNASTTSTTVNSRNIPFVLVSISYQPGLSQLPSYVVSVYTDGTVLFQGIRGVSHIGEFKYKISTDIFSIIQDVMEKSNFYSIDDNLTVIPDSPYIATSYKMAADIDAKQLIDYNNGEPAQLIALRQEVEQILNDKVYINGDKNGVLVPLGKLPIVDENYSQ